MISVIICSIDAARFRAVKEHYCCILAHEAHEIIGVHDAKSMCEGYNRGMAQSRGEIVIFSHDDVEVWVHDLAKLLRHHFERFDGIGVAGTNRLIMASWIDAGPPYIFGQVASGPPGEPIFVNIYGTPARVVPNISAMDGLFLAFRREGIRNLRWDEETFTGFHCYDIDFTYCAFQAGLRLGVAVDLPILHMSLGNFDDSWTEQALLLERKHRLPRHRRVSFPRIYIDHPNKEHALAAMTRLYMSLPE